MLQLFDVFCCIFQKPECIIAAPLAMFANLRTVILTLFCGPVHHCKPPEQKQPLAEVLRGAVGCLKRKETEKVRKKVRPL